MGLAKDFLWPGEYFWDGDRRMLYVSDTQKDPDFNPKTIFAVIYDPQSEEWKSIKLHGWSYSYPTVFKVVSATTPLSL